MRELELAKEIGRRKAGKDLIAFTTQTKPDYTPNWHHKATAKLLEALHDDWTPRQYLAWCGIKGAQLAQMMARPHEVTKLYAGMTRPEMIDEPLKNIQIWMSPRTGKSELMSRRGPAWILGRAPDTQIIACSYGASLSSQMNRDVQRIIDDPRYAEVFPGTKLYGKNIRSTAAGAYLRNSEIFEVVNHSGFYKSAGVGGSVTGLGAHVAIVDDPFKSRKSVESPVERLTVWEWWSSTLYTRLEKGGKRILACTRWHAADTSGLVNEAAAADPESEQFFCLVFPALLDCEPGPGDPRKQGEALWPEKYSVKKLAQMKASMGSYEFEALHQQRPSPKGGGIVKEEWWQFYERLPEGLTDHTLSVDLSFKDRGDFSAFQVWAAKGADRFLCDQYHGRMTFTQQVKVLMALCRKWPMAATKLVEDAANGAALIDTLKHEVQGLVPIRATQSKELRVDAVSPQIEAGNVYLPSRRLAPWVDGFISEFNFFPNGASDDMVDACSQALFYMRQQQFDYNFLAQGVHKQSQWL